MKDKPFELNDRVYDMFFGWGIVTETSKSDGFKNIAQPFKYNVKFDNGEEYLYDINGKQIASQCPTLFLKNRNQQLETALISIRQNSI